MILIELPPQASPKLVTAYKRIESMGEHATAFLNTNNQKSWVEYEPEEVSELALILGELLTRKEHSRIDLKKVNAHLRLKVLPRKVGMQRVYDMLGRLLGYNNWQEAAKSSGEDMPIKNLSFGKSFQKASQDAAARVDPNDSVFIKKASRLRRYVNGEKMLKLLRSSCSPVGKDKLRKKMRDAAREVMGGTALEDWKKRDIAFAAFPDPNDSLVYWLVVEPMPFNIVPKRDYSTLKIKLELNPVSRSVKSIHIPTSSDKTLAQWYFS